MAQALQDDRDRRRRQRRRQLCDAFGIRNDPQYDPPAALSIFVDAAAAADGVARI